jgi:hypothetical protein
MADLFLTWDEAQGELLPHYCVSCAAPATEWADWRISKARLHIFTTHCQYVNVTLPVCPEHRKPSWIFLYRVVAREVHEDGVVLGHISPGFVEAVFDYRDDVESGFAPLSACRSPRHDYEVDDFEEPPPRRLARYAPNVPIPSAWTPGKIILLVFVVLLFAPCALISLLAVLMGLIASL